MTVTRHNTKEEEFIVAESATGQRLDAFLASAMPEHVSRSRVKDIVKQGGVSLNGQICTTPNQRMKPDDVIRMNVPEPEDAIPRPENIPLEIAYEDDDLLVVNKPVGMVVHPAIGNWTGTLVNALLYHCGDSLAGIGGVKRPGIVHRLDKDTSGLLVVAKNEKALANLSKQFADHGRTGSLKRLYEAIVWGEPSPRSGTIDTFIGRSGSNRKKRAVVNENQPDAKHAITHYRTLNSWNDGEEVVLSTIACELETGRTHQIRVHMAHIGHPLVGDQDYGKHFQTKLNKLPEKTASAISKFQRQALHARILGFEHPVSGKFLQFEAEPPEDFTTLIRSFENEFSNN